MTGSIVVTDASDAAWAEYDAAADWCASKGFTGSLGTPLPETLSAAAVALVELDPESFGLRVREHAYARAMEVVS